MKFRSFRQIRTQFSSLSQETQLTIFFVFFMIISSIYFTQPTFIDELDNIVNGNFISKGKLPYKDFFSQHTPLVYIISGIGHILWADSVFLQRLFFYAIFSAAFCFLIKRHGKILGVKVVFFTGLIY